MPRGHDAERAAPNREGQRPVHLGPVLAGGHRGPGQHTARPLGAIVGHRHLDLGLRQLDGQAASAESVGQRGEQLIEHRAGADLGGNDLHRPMQVGELGGAADKMLVEPLELLHLVDEAVDQPLVELAEVGPLLALLDVLALAVQELLDLAGERIHVDRLLDIPVAAGHQRVLSVFVHRVGRQRDDRRVGEGGERLEHRHDFVAVDAGQVDVEQDQGRFLAHGGLDAGQPVLGVDDGVALRLEDRPGEHPVLRVVLDVQDLGALAVAVERGSRHVWPPLSSVPAPSAG